MPIVKTFSDFKKIFFIGLKFSVECPAAWVKQGISTNAFNTNSKKLLAIPW